MSSAPSALEIARDARWLAQAFDPDAGVARLIAMSRDCYRAASFLDDRMLQRQVDARIVDWTAIETAVGDNARTDARWIFHIGHVGSTLVSRLIGELGGVLAIREPRLLRDLAMISVNDRARYSPTVQRLLSRTFAPNEVACIKATSFVSEFASELVPQGERALFMFASPLNYIASNLAGESNLNDLRGLEQSRTERLRSRDIHLQAPANDAERAAAAWATEVTSLELAARAMANREITWIDFDRMLENMASSLSGIVRFFGFEASPEQIIAISQSPLVRRYSKAVEYEYSPQLRANLIRDSLQRNAREIRGAIAMLEKAAEKSAILAGALDRSQRES